MTITIKQLDSVTITKIAAGEVIDRPASIVKELIENAIDAEASTIVIEVKEGGKDYIRITDNGIGISPEDLPLAPMRHTTSKISSVEDIYDTDTFGFRGEALASICHCAKLSITSKQDSGKAYTLSAFQDEISEPMLSSHNIGTTMEIHDLFHQLPVRRKFLKSTATELSYILECCLHFAVIHPQKSFTLIANGVEKINTTGISKLYDLLITLYGNTLKDTLIPVHETIGPITFSGYISSPTLTFPNRHKQIIAVNSRVVKNPLIQKSLFDAYRDLIPQRRFPLVVLRIEIQSSQVDVNIHPQKQDVKFVNPGFIFDALPKAISLALHASSAHTDSIPSIAQPTSASSYPTHAFTASPSATVSEQSASQPIAYQNGTPPITKKVMEQSLDLFAPHQTPSSSSSLEFLQLLDTYIVLKTPDGAYIIDQHAVHERVLYEKIKSDFGKDGARQVLLLSDVISIPLTLMPIFESHHDYLKSLNFIIEPFGPDQLIVREVPVAFQHTTLQDLIQSILSQLQAFPGSTRDLTLDQKETLQRQACRAAIKAGQTLAEVEIIQLLKDFISSPQNYTCPHGRPLFIHFDQHKLETLFLRK